MKKNPTVLHAGRSPLGQMAGVITILLVVTLASCSPDPAQQTGRYYAVDSLVTAQVKLLTASHASTVKTATLDGREETRTIQPKDTVAWLDELGIFRELRAMNKPTNRGRYKVTDGVSDQKSNLTVKTVVADTLAKNSDDLQVRFVKIYYHHVPQQVKRIEAVFHEKSWLYKSARHLTLEFDQTHQQNVVTGYSIRGGQKMFLGDTVTFVVKGSISIPD